MKRFLLVFALLLSSIQLFANYCGNLGITIENTTAHDCVLRYTRMDYGYMQDQVPTTIPAGSTSPTFYMHQGFFGLAVLLDYRCDNKTLIFYSSQDYCRYSAGMVNGEQFYENGSELHMDHKIELGSYWSKLPGQITWRIRR